MPVKVRCPECEKVLSLPDQARGKAVKCPSCAGRVPVPAGSKSAKPPRKKAPAKKSRPAGGGEAEQEDVLAKIDLSRAEDYQTRVCPKCGLEVDEEDIECPKCGVNIATGRLSAEKQAKKARGGPDPDKYYERFLKEGWNFTKEHWKFGLRTALYLIIPYTIAMIAIYFSVYFHLKPLIFTCVMIAAITSYVGPGWCFFLHTTIIQWSIDKKIKLDRVNFDFFLSAYLGIKYQVWSVVFNLPFLVITGALAYAIGGAAGIVVALIGILPGLFVTPVVMAHMQTPGEWRAWLSPWILKRFFSGLVGPSLYWCMFAFASTLVSMIFGIIIWAAASEGLTELHADLQYNATVRAAMDAAEEDSKDNEGASSDFTEEDLREIDLTPAITAMILAIVAMVPMGFAVVFNARTNGLLTYYYRPELELDLEEKQVKWKRKKKHGDEFDDDAGGGWDTGDTAEAAVKFFGVIIFYVIINVISYFSAGVLILPRPIAQALNLMSE